MLVVAADATDAHANTRLIAQRQNGQALASLDNLCTTIQIEEMISRTKRALLLMAMKALRLVSSFGFLMEYFFAHFLRAFAKCRY